MVTIDASKNCGLIRQPGNEDRVRNYTELLLLTWWVCPPCS